MGYIASKLGVGALVGAILGQVVGLVERATEPLPPQPVGTWTAPKADALPVWAAKALEDLVSDSSFASLSARDLGYGGVRQAIPVLVARTGSGTLLAAACIDALAALGGPEARACLEALVRSGGSDPRRFFAARALAQAGDRLSARLLREAAADDDANELFREAARVAADVIEARETVQAAVPVVRVGGQV